MADVNDTSPESSAQETGDGKLPIITTLLQNIGLHPRASTVMPAADTTGLTLVLVVAAMCYLACLAFGAMLTVTRTAADWTAELEGSLTIQVKPHETMSGDDQITAALAVLNATPGIESAEALTDDAVRALLDPWLGDSTSTGDLPLPSLIDVQISPGANPDLSALAVRLAAAAPGIALDTHRQWLSELLSAARSATLLSIAILALITATTIAIVVFATRSALSANHESVEVLHLVGARDEFVANEVQRHFLQLGLQGGSAGLLVAIVTFLLITWLGSEGGAFLLPVPGLQAADYPWLILVPATIGLTTTLTARVTVLRVLGRLI